MRAAVLHEVGRPLQIEEVLVDDLQDHEVLVDTVVAGLCHTDLHFVRGDWLATLPIVLGHEAAGVVAATGRAVTRVRPGDHVVVYNAPACGRCKQCLRGRPTLCPFPVHGRADPRPRLTLAGRPVGVHSGLGAFAEQMLVNEAAVSTIHDDIPFEAAALISCAVMAGFGGTAFTAKAGPGDSIAIIGAGGVGLNAVQAARHVGAFPIVVVDTNADNLELARKLGATHTVDASTQDPVAAVLELTGGGVDHAVEAIGLKVTTEQAWQMLDAGGCVTVLGLLPVAARIELPPQDLLSEKRIQGSHMGSLHWELQVPMLLDLYLAGRLELDSLVTRRLHLDQINDGYADLGKASGRQVISFG